jgi:hypothetical protein
MPRLLPLLAAVCLSPILFLPAEAQDKSKKQKPTLPPVIDPGVSGTLDKGGTPPSDAVVLFDGKSFDGWENTRKGKAIDWKLVDGAMEIAPSTGSIRTKQAFGYGHYHVEFRTPAVVKGKGQGRGNSGVYVMGRHEIQVLDSYENETYPDGQCGAIYGQHIPLVNACRKPGVWQSFDIVFHPPAVDDKGKAVRRGAFTILHNGVLIHDLAEVNATSLDQKGPLLLQDHGNPVQFRNLWYRPYRKPTPRK